MNKNITPEMLIRYLDNEASAEEIALVESELYDDEVSAQLHKLQIAKQAFKQHALKREVSAIRKKMLEEKAVGDDAILKNANDAGAKTIKQEERTGKVRWLRTAMRIAAIVILLIVVAVIIQYSLLDNQRLYSAQYQTFELGTARDERTPSDVEKAYRNNDFPLVVQLYKLIVPPAITDHFLAGQAYLALNDAPNAIAAFETQLALNRYLSLRPYQDDTEYYLALAYLKGGYISKALALFEQIYEQPSHAYHREVSGWYIFKLQMLKRKS